MMSFMTFLQEMKLYTHIYHCLRLRKRRVLELEGTNRGMGKENTTKTRGNFLPLGSGNSGACVEIEEHEVFEYDFEYPLGLTPACCSLSSFLESLRGFMVK